jgi:hypothetical protein
VFDFIVQLFYSERLFSSLINCIYLFVAYLTELAIVQITHARVFL